MLNIFWNDVNLMLFGFSETADEKSEENSNSADHTSMLKDLMNIIIIP